MKNNRAETKWWSALSSWLVKYQGRADYLFIYDGKRGKLDRCFDRNISLSSVDEATISKLYQAAAEGRLGLLRPKDLKPLLLTTDPEKMFSSGKEVRVVQDGMPAAPEQEIVPEREPVLQREPVSRQEPVSRREPAGDKGEPETERKLDVRDLERAVVDPVVVDRLREAEALYRNVVYAPRKPTPSVPAGVVPKENSAAKESTDQAAALEKAVEAVRNAMPLQLGDGFGREQEQLITDLAQMVLSLSETDERQTERLEQERKAREELIAAQNLFICAAVSDKRDREEFKTRMEMLDQLDKLSAERLLGERQWWRRMENVSRELYDMDMAGASESACSEKIRDYLDGKIQSKREEALEANQEEDPMVFGSMWGNALRHFCRFAASEVPLSVRHMQVAEHCRKIVGKIEGQGFSMDDLGLDLQEQMVVQGTIEMGVLIEHGLRAQEALTSDRRLSPRQYREHLQNYLAMKGIEETLTPHVQAHQKEISTGDGPVSALQILMANRGFSADDLRAKAGKTEVMANLKRMDPKQVARMIRQNGSEIATMGQQVMLASCQMDDMPERSAVSANEPKVPQKGGPQL